MWAATIATRNPPTHITYLTARPYQESRPLPPPLAGANPRVIPAKSLPSTRSGAGTQKTLACTFAPRPRIHTRTPNPHPHPHARSHHPRPNTHHQIRVQVTFPAQNQLDFGFAIAYNTGDY